MKLDHHTFLDSITVPGDGWRFGRIVLKNGPRQPFEGFIGPDGTAWEHFDVPTKPAELKHFTQRVRNQQVAGYTQAIVTVLGKQCLAERFMDNVKPWDGLDLVGTWVDSSCNGMPWQHSIEGTFRDLRVALYIRWRYDDPWTGHVVRLAPGDNLALLYKYPWSPNLLPTDKPLPVSEQPTKLLDFLNTPRLDSWITEYEVERAKKVMVERADAWLCERGENPDAWKTT